MESLGVEVLKSRGFFPHAYWYWIGVGGLIGYILVFNAGFTLALTYLNRALLHFIHFHTYELVMLCVVIWYKQLCSFGKATGF